MTRTFLSALALAALVAGPALAQSDRGQISGFVIDQTGAVVPGATVTVTHTQTQQVRTTVTDTTGYYAFPALTPGTYDLSVELEGFIPAAAGKAFLRIAELRMLRGDIAAAEEALLRGHALGYDPEPTLSLLRLAQGRVDVATTRIREALDVEHAAAGVDVLGRRPVCDQRHQRLRRRASALPERSTTRCWRNTPSKRARSQST